MRSAQMTLSIMGVWIVRVLGVAAVITHHACAVIAYHSELGLTGGCRLFGEPVEQRVLLLCFQLGLPLRAPQLVNSYRTHANAQDTRHCCAARMPPPCAKSRHHGTHECKNHHEQVRSTLGHSFL